MTISKRQAQALYEKDAGESTAGSGKISKMSNKDLLHYLSGLCKLEKGVPAERVAAEVFLRPRMAMRYNLLPVLSRILAPARPCAGASPAVEGQQRLQRSLALLLTLANADWQELPKSWTFLGSALEDNNLELAREYLNAILASIPVRDPMLLLKEFTAPAENDISWQRFFWLTEKDLNDFTNEKQETINIINQEDEESAE